MDWLDTFAASLEERLGSRQALGPRSEKGRLLELAREVAHSTERKNAPLATYIAGRYVALRVADGADAATAVEEVSSVARSLLQETR